MDICLFMLNEKTKGRKIRGQIEEERERKGEREEQIFIVGFSITITITVQVAEKFNLSTLLIIPSLTNNQLQHPILNTWSPI